MKGFSICWMSQTQGSPELQGSFASLAAALFCTTPSPGLPGDHRQSESHLQVPMQDSPHSQPLPARPGLCSRVFPGPAWSLENGSIEQWASPGRTGSHLGVRTVLTADVPLLPLCWGWQSEVKKEMVLALWGAGLFIAAALDFPCQQITSVITTNTDFLKERNEHWTPRFWDEQGETKK